MNLKTILNYGIREQIGITIIIPELFSVISSGHNLTHQLYVLHGYSEKAKMICDYIKKHDLYIYWVHLHSASCHLGFGRVSGKNFPRRCSQNCT